MRVDWQLAGLVTALGRKKRDETVAAYYPVGFFQELVDVVEVVASSCWRRLALLQQLIEGWCEVRHFGSASPAVREIVSVSFLATCLS